MKRAELIKEINEYGFLVEAESMPKKWLEKRLARLKEITMEQYGEWLKDNGLKAEEHPLEEYVREEKNGNL